MSTGVLETQKTTPPEPPNITQPSSLARFRPFVAPYKWHYTASIVIALIATSTGLAIPLVMQRVIDGPRECPINGGSNLGVG